MSEIKGQLLGIILVLTIFVSVSAALTGIFKNMTSSVEEHVSEVVENIDGDSSSLSSEN